jgi:DnaJ family protein A protein 2
MSNLYEILNVDKKANREDIKKAYRNLALIHHPDRGGNPDKFKRINEAYKILENEKSRKEYDKTGSTENVMIKELIMILDRLEQYQKKKKK